MKTKHQTGLQSESTFTLTERIGGHWRVWLLIACAGVLGIGLAMSWARVRAAERSEDGLWEQAEQMTLRLRERGEIPALARVFRLEQDLLARVLAGGAKSFGKEGGDKRGVMTLPMPDGAFARVRLEEVQVMEPALAARFPEIKNYRGESLERGAWSVRITHSPQGLSAFVTDGERTVSVQPLEVDGARYYVSAWGQDYETLAGEARCLVGETELRGQGELTRRTARRSLRMSAPPVGATLRTYKLAIATTPQYVTDFGDAANAQTSLTTWVNVLKGIFEKELSVTFTLVTNESVIGNAQFNGLSLTQLVDKSRDVLQQNIGLGNYDLGLVFGTGTTSGLSYIGAVCDNGGDGSFAYKGGGAVLFATGCGVNCNAGNDVGAGMLAHEVGHLFGATHTSNAECSSNTRVAETAYEAGSGLTLMSNAGNCESDNIASARALHFHSGSFEQMAAFINVNGGCATVTTTGNAPPTVTAASSFVIPKLTPFTLTATGNDADSADLPNLTYVWEEVDAGGDFPNPPYADQAGDPQGTTRPLFRPFAPAANGASRTFPKLEYIQLNANMPPAVVSGLQTAENLPAISRQLNFNVTVRDGRGGVGNAPMQLNVADAGPFRVSSHNSAAVLQGGSNANITWELNGPDAAQFSSLNVKITLSTDGGNTFPITLAASTPNNGAKEVLIPNISASNVRFKVEAIGNIFFDLSDANLTITPNCGIGEIDSVSQGFTSGGGSGTVNLRTAQGCNWTATSNAVWITITSGASGVGNGLWQPVSYYVAANPTSSLRTGIMTVAGQIFTVTQAGIGGVVGLQFYPLPAPVRLLETRAGLNGCIVPGATLTGTGDFSSDPNLDFAVQGRSPVASPCNSIPASAQMLVGNTTSVTPDGGGFLTIYPSGGLRPTVASSNYYYCVTESLDKLLIRSKPRVFSLLAAGTTR